jgi:hypothetical protein
MAQQSGACMRDRWTMQGTVFSSAIVLLAAALGCQQRQPERRGLCT